MTIELTKYKCCTVIGNIRHPGHKVKHTEHLVAVGGGLDHTKDSLHHHGDEEGELPAIPEEEALRFRINISHSSQSF